MEKERQERQEGKGRSFPGGQCQGRLIVLLVRGYFHKSILICYIINNNLIKNPKYSIVSFLFEYFSLL